MRRVLLILTILSVTVCLNGLGYAQEFTNESIEGNYAFNGSAGSGTVILGLNNFDGNGNLSGPAIQRFGARRRNEINLSGTYIVNPDGTGIVTGKIDFGRFESPEQTLDFVIMQAEVVNGVKLATEIFMVQRSGDLLNVPSFTYKRLPDN